MSIDREKVNAPDESNIEPATPMDPEGLEPEEDVGIDPPSNEGGNTTLSDI